jgi:hypothetical protein
MKLSLLALIFLSFAQQALATPQIVALCKFSEDLGGRTSTDESYISWHLGQSPDTLQLETLHYIAKISKPAMDPADIFHLQLTDKEKGITEEHDLDERGELALKPAPERNLFIHCAIQN